MKINKKVFYDFLKKSGLEDTEKLGDVVLNFTAEGMVIEAMSQTNTSSVSNILNASVFEEYSAIGKIGLSEFDIFIKVVNTIKAEEISLSVEGNLLNIKGASRKVDVTLIDLQHIDDVKIPNLSYEESFIIDSKILHDFVESVKINKDELNLVMETFDKKLVLSCLGKYKFEEEFLNDSIKGGVKCKFGEPLFHCIKNLVGDVTLQIKTDYPITVTESNDNYTVKIICAPRIENN